MASAEDSRFHLGCPDLGAPMQLRGSGLSRSSAVGLGAGTRLCGSDRPAGQRRGLDQHLNSFRLYTTSGKGELVKERGQELRAKSY